MRLDEVPISQADVRGIAVQQGRIDRLRAQAYLLGDEDRALLAMYLDAGSSVRQIARLTAMSPSTISRRIRRIIRRLLNDLYSVCLRHRHRFSDLELAITRDYFIRGLSARRISREHDVSYYSVLTAIEKARGFARSLEDPQS